LLGEHASAELWQQQLDQAVEQARAAEASANNELQSVREQRVQLAAELKAQQERLLALEAEHRELSGKVNDWRALHPELDDGGLETLLGIDDQQVSELRQRLQASEKAMEQAKVLVQERETQLQQHQAQHADMDDSEQLAAALSEAQSLSTNHDQLCADLRAQISEDERRRTANSELQARIQAANSEYLRWARLATLIGSAEGDKFRKIAQAYNLDLLVHHANAQLQATGAALSPETRRQHARPAGDGHRNGR
jgi:exonuclease SbcC